MENFYKKGTLANYIETLIWEKKGISIMDDIEKEGHIGLTWKMFIDYVDAAKEYHGTIRNTLIKIDFQAGDVFHYLYFLIDGMLKACGYE